MQYKKSLLFCILNEVSKRTWCLRDCASFKYNNVYNKMRQTFSFISLFNSALHVLGHKFTHPQEHFLTIYTAFGTMHWHCCRLVSSSVGALYQKLYIQSKSTPEDGRICCPKHAGWIKKNNKWKSCCLLLVIYIVVREGWWKLDNEALHDLYYCPLWWWRKKQHSM
jgi:hypothetical protein